MNKRTFKKRISQVCGELAAVTFYSREHVDCGDVETVNILIGKIADLQYETKRQCSFSFDKAERDFDNGKSYRDALHAYNKAAFGKIEKDFEEQITSILKKINSLVPKDHSK